MNCKHRKNAPGEKPGAEIQSNSIISQNIVMADIYQRNDFFFFMIPNDTDIHIHAEFKQLVRPLNSFCP